MRASIFVTDDEPAIRSALVKRLSRRQHQVKGFDSGDALLDALDRDIPDLILLDLKMPGLSGLDTLKELQPKSPHSLVIMLTAYGTVQDAVEAMKLGAADFVQKSRLNLEELRRLLDGAATDEGTGKKRVMSTAARMKIAAAQRARWAKAKRI